MVGTSGYAWPCVFLKTVVGIPLLVTVCLVFLLLPFLLLTILRVILEVSCEPHKDIAVWADEVS